MDAIDEAYLRNNVEVLAKEGFTKDPNKLIEQAREVARQALDDEEGRINPQGNYENELVTAVFGQPESAPQIRNAKLRQLLEDKKLQHAYRSYDVDALAGLVPTARAGSHLIGSISKTITRPSMISCSSPNPKPMCRLRTNSSCRLRGWCGEGEASRGRKAMAGEGYGFAIL